MAGRTKLMMVLSSGITTAVVQASNAGSRLGPSTAVFLGVGLFVVVVVVALVLFSDKATDNLVRIIAMVRGIVPRATSLSRRSNDVNGDDAHDGGDHQGSPAGDG